MFRFLGMKMIREAFRDATKLWFFCSGVGGGGVAQLHVVVVGGVFPYFEGVFI